MPKVTVFIGMTDGLIEEIKVFHSKAKAISAWENYTKSSWKEFIRANKINGILKQKYCGTNLYETDFEEDMYRKQYAGYTVSDVMSIYSDMSEEQALNTMLFADKFFDASEGFTWDNLKHVVSCLYPQLELDDNYEE